MFQKHIFHFPAVLLFFFFLQEHSCTMSNLGWNYLSVGFTTSSFAGDLL